MPWARRAWGGTGPSSTPNERGLDRALEAGRERGRDLRQRDRDLQPARTSTGRWPSRSKMFRAGRGARTGGGGLWVRAYVSMCFGDPWEGDVPIGQVADSAEASLMDAGRGRALARRHHRRGHARARRGPARRARGHRGIASGGRRGALPRHVRAGPGQHDDRPAPGRLASVDASAGGLGGCPYAKSGDRQPRHRGPGLGAARHGGSRPAWTSSQASWPRQRLDAAAAGAPLREQRGCGH
jgi:hydroxymethylglutaryl-CoA lyase